VSHRSKLILAFAAAVLGGLAWGLYPARDGHGKRRRGGTAAGRETPPVGGEVQEREDVSGAPKDLLAGISRALAERNVQATRDAAAALRRRLRTNDPERRHAERLLLDRATPKDLRMVLALVLGTLEGSDAVLLRALERFREDAEVLRCILFGLGATRDPPDDDDVFGLGDRPWGAHGPGGLGITVHRAIDDVDVRRAVAGCLRDGRGPVRQAAAVSLRHSAAAADVRAEFGSALRAESVDDVALVLGETLAVWAGGAGDRVERVQVVNLLLVRAGDPGLDGYRFRMEDDFRRIPLTAEQRAQLAEYARPAHTLAVRSFALSALASAARRGHDGPREVLEGTLEGDRDAAVRDLSARLLGTLPHAGRSVMQLAGAALGDAAWNVRYQAVDALGRFPGDKRAVEAIRAATKDKDARVASHARALIERLEKRR